MLRRILLVRMIKDKLINFNSVVRFRGNDIHKMICIIDFDKVGSVREIEGLFKEYGIRPENQMILGYKKNSDETNFEGVPLFTQKDIDAKGRIKNYHVDMITWNEYDILINYFDTDNLILEWLSLQIEAKIRVGFGNLRSEKYNNIEFGCDIKDVKLFCEEFKRVIKTINCD